MNSGCELIKPMSIDRVDPFEVIVLRLKKNLVLFFFVLFLGIALWFSVFYPVMYSWHFLFFPLLFVFSFGPQVEQWEPCIQPSSLQAFVPAFVSNRSDVIQHQHQHAETHQGVSLDGYSGWVRAFQKPKPRAPRDRRTAPTRGEKVSQPVKKGPLPSTRTLDSEHFGC